MLPKKEKRRDWATNMSDNVTKEGGGGGWRFHGSCCGATEGSVVKGDGGFFCGSGAKVCV